MDENLLKKLSKATPGSKAVIKTWARSSMISPEMLGYTIGVHNGKEHIAVLIGEDMVGQRLGEVSPHPQFFLH